MAALSLGHLAADLSQGALPAVLVFLKPLLHLSYTKTAVVVLVATLTSSVAQPLFGIWSDRRGAVWLTWFGVGLGGVGIAFAALTPNYPVLLVLVGLSGLGIGAFHPEAMKAAHGASGSRRASGMALFSTGGNLGFSLGPLIATGAIAGLGLSGGVLLLVPATVVAPRRPLASVAARLRRLTFTASRSRANRSICAPSSPTIIRPSTSPTVAGTAPAARTASSTSCARRRLSGYGNPCEMIVDSSATTGSPAATAARTSSRTASNFCMSVGSTYPPAPSRNGQG